MLSIPSRLVISARETMLPAKVARSKIFTPVPKDMYRHSENAHDLCPKTQTYSTTTQTALHPNVALNSETCLRTGL